MAAIDGIELPEQPPTCVGGHGPMATRNPPRGYTREQRWCGVWFDCQQCRSSVLIPSPELLAARSSSENMPIQPALPF